MNSNFKMFLVNKDMSMSSLAKKTSLPYTTINRLVNDRLDINDCNAAAVYKISKALGVSMEQLINEEEDDFELFKSYVCQQVHALGYIEFIKKVLSTDIISSLYADEKYAEALYMLAMLDYQSNKHDIPLYKKYDPLRSLKLREPLYPRDIELLTVLYNSNTVKEQAWDAAIPEFKRHNIVENEVENVC